MESPPEEKALERQKWRKIDELKTRNLSTPDLRAETSRILEDYAERRREQRRRTGGLRQWPLGSALSSAQSAETVSPRRPDDALTVAESAAGFPVPGPSQQVWLETAKRAAARETSATEPTDAAVLKKMQEKAEEKADEYKELWEHSLMWDQCVDWVLKAAEEDEEDVEGFDLLMRVVHRFLAIEPLVRAEEMQCIKYACTCSKYWKCKFCAHVLAVALHRGEIQPPTRSDGTYLTEARGAGRPGTVARGYMQRDDD